MTADGFYTDMIRRRQAAQQTSGAEYWLECTDEEQLRADYIAGYCTTEEFEKWLGQKLALETGQHERPL